MKQRAISFLLALSMLLSCLLMHTSAAGNKAIKQETETKSDATAVANSDIEAYESEWYYYVDLAEEGFVYRERADFTNKKYITDFPVKQIAVMKGKLYMSVGQTIIRLDVQTGGQEEIATAGAEILRFALCGDTLYYLAEGTLQCIDLKTNKAETVLKENGLKHFWLEDLSTVAYMVDDMYIYYYELKSGSVTKEENQLSSLDNQKIKDGDYPETKGLSVSSLREKFPHGKYWNHMPTQGTGKVYNNQNGWTTQACSTHNKYCGTAKQTCNGFMPESKELSWQCMGYAEKCGYDATGYNPRNNSNGWHTYTGSSALDNLKAGDIVRYKNDGHSIYVIAVNGDTITYTDCNSDNHCLIRWDATISKSTLRSTFTHLRSAPVTVQESNLVIESKYQTPFKAYTLSTEKVVCYNSIGGSSPGKIYPTDECTIQEIYTNGWCKVLCPWEDNSVKTVYVETSTFIYDPAYVPNEHYILTGVKGYTRNNLQEEYASIGAETHFWRIGKVDGKTQILFWTESIGWRAMWITHPGDRVKGIDIGSNFYAYIINTEQWRHVTNDRDNVSLRKEIPNESQVWKFEYQGNGYYKIINCLDGKALDVEGAYSAPGTNVQVYGVHDSTAQLWMICSGGWNDRVTLEPKCSDNGVLDVFENSTDEGANLLIWTYHGGDNQIFDIYCDVSYSVVYEPNGGSGAPEKQIGQYMTTFSLSTQKPIGQVFSIKYDANGGTLSATGKTVSKTFKNWNTNRDGSGTTYNAGANFTIRNNIVLYAQWNNATAGTLATPTRDNYTFDGWYTSVSGGSKVTSSSVISANTTLYAHWSHVCAGGHSYSYKATKNPTTSATGTLTGTCSKCSGTTTVTLPKLNTTDYTKTTTKAATCTATGTDSYKWKTTTYGTFSFTVTTAAKGHTHVTDKAVEATCTATGLTEGSHCSVCNAVIKAQTTVAALGHSYTSKVTAPSCEAQGYTTYTCSRCSHSYKDNYTNATNHSYSYKATKDPTTSTTGTLTGTCSKCSGTTTVTLPKLNTTDYTKTTTKAATCTATGADSYKWKTTTYGTFSFTVTTAAKGHTPVTDKAVAATCTEAGKTEGSHCSVCNAVIKAQSTVAALGHSYSYANTGENHEAVCSVCTHSFTEDHSYTDNVCVCGANAADNPKKIHVETNNLVLKLGETESVTIYAWASGYHNGNWTINYSPGSNKISCKWGEWTEDRRIPLTVTAKAMGTSIITLSIRDKDTGTVLDSTKVSVTVDAKAYTLKYNANGGSGAPSSQIKYHNTTLTLSNTKPTRQGYTFLGWSTSSTATSATYQLGGSFTENADTTLYAVWKKGCEINAHRYSYKVTKDPTTSAAGTLTGTCSECSETTTATLPKLNTADYTKTTTTAATCTANGTDKYTWKTTTYGTFSFNVTTNKLGHSYTIKVTPPTCSAQGYTTHTCSRCSDSYKDTYTNATGHSYSYTEEETGHRTTCSLCAHSFTEPHSYTDNICVCGAKEVLAPITDGNIVINHSLNLASDISINYAVNAGLLSGYDNFHLEIQVPIYNGDALTGFKNVSIDPVLNGSYYYFTMTEVTAVNMNDILVATLHMNKGKQEYVSKPDSYSIATYALNQLNKDGAAQKLKALCADLLRYGASAQMFKGYRTDALATASMTAAHKGYLSNLNTVTFGNTNTVYNDLTNPMITWAGKTLNLGSKVMVKFVFNAGVYTGNISNLTLRMIYRDNSGAYRTVTLTNPTVYSEVNRQYAFEFDGLMAAELRTPLSVAVYNGDTQLSQTLQYSPDTYGNNKTGVLGELCKALFAYSDSARKFFS